MMPESQDFENSHQIRIYPYHGRAERRKSIFGLIFSILGFLAGIDMIVVNYGGNALKGNLISLFWAVGICVFSWKVMSGPMVFINEKSIKVRNNMFLPYTVIRWEDIRCISLQGKPLFAHLDFYLSDAALRTFWRSQSRFNKNRITKRLYEQEIAASFPQAFSPYSLPSLLSAIQEQFQEQIDHNQIVIESERQ